MKEISIRTKRTIKTVSAILTISWILGICILIVEELPATSPATSAEELLISGSILVFGAFIVYYIPQLVYRSAQLVYRLGRRSTGSKRLRLILSATLAVLWGLLNCIIIIDEGHIREEEIFIFIAGMIVAFIPYLGCEAVHWISDGFKKDREEGDE